MASSASRRPRILVLGEKGLTGGAPVNLLDQDRSVEVVRAARRPEQISAWLTQAAVAIELNDAAVDPAANSAPEETFND